MKDLSYYPYYVVVDGADHELMRCARKERAVRIADRKHEATGEPHSVYFYQSRFNNRIVYRAPEPWE